MSHEVHVVAVEELSPDASQRVVDVGFDPVRVSGRHPCLVGAELYSAYVDSARTASAIFAQAVDVCRELDDVGLLVERERVVRDAPLDACSVDAVDARSVRERLATVCNHGRRYQRSKQADIHLSIPTAALDERTASLLAEFDVTFLRVARRGDEEIFGRRPPPGEDWTAYTVQLNGPAAHDWAVELFELLPQFLWPDQPPPMGTMKVEYAAEVFITDRHPGIPAVSAE